MCYNLGKSDERVIIMTFEKKFETLKKSLIKADTKKFTEGFAFQVNITDEDCAGAFYIAFVNGEYSVEPYDYKDRTALLTGAADDVAKLAKGTVAVSVEGNVGQVEMYAASFKKPAAKKAPAKKPAAKKAEPAKKEAPAKKVEEAPKTEPVKKTVAEVKKPAVAKAAAPVAKTAAPAAKPAEKTEMKTTKTPAVKTAAKTTEKKK